jgi:hypothetical protein
LKKKLEAELKARGRRSVVQVAEPELLQRTEFKRRRVIDKRSLYDEISQQKQESLTAFESVRPTYLGTP